MLVEFPVHPKIFFKACMIFISFEAFTQNGVKKQKKQKQKLVWEL